MFHGIGRGIFNILLPGVAPTLGVPACLSQYFIEIYIAIYHGERRSRQGRRGADRFADVFWAEVFKFSLRLIMSPPLNRRDRNYDRKARERAVVYIISLCPAGDHAQISHGCYNVYV